MEGSAPHITPVGASQPLGTLFQLILLNAQQSVLLNAQSVLLNVSVQKCSGFPHPLSITLLHKGGTVSARGDPRASIFKGPVSLEHFRSSFPTVASSGRFAT